MQTQPCEEHRVMLIVAAFVAGALLLFLFGIDRYPRYGLDESIYVSSARSLIDGTSIWTPDHPPLGKSLIAVGIKFAGDRALGWRASGAVAGSLTLAAIMLLAYALLHSVEYMVIAGLLTMFDNFLFVMSRTATLDTFLMLFMFWGYLLFAAAVGAEGSRRKQTICLILSGILFGLAAACKWNALFSIATVFAIALCPNGRRRNFSIPALLASFSALPAVAYAVTFIPLFRSKGMAFSVMNLLSAQREMFLFMKPITGNIFINDPWFYWPFQIEPQRGLNFLVGNYAVTFSGVVALGFCAWRLFRRAALPELTIVSLYLANWLQWVVIPRRIVYYYYYYPCALLLSIALVLALARWQRKSLFGVRLGLIPVLAAILIFLFCYPRMAGLGAPWDTALGYWR